MKKCASGNQEIFEHRFCDGIIDCADESDEQGCSCKYTNLLLGFNLWSLKLIIIPLMSFL